jgi:hypothetical protein
MHTINSRTKALSPEQGEELLSTLQARFEKNMHRHAGLEWAKVQAKLEANPEKLGSLNEMRSSFRRIHCYPVSSPAVRGRMRAGRGPRCAGASGVRKRCNPRGLMTLYHDGSSIPAVQQCLIRNKRCDTDYLQHSKCLYN